MKFGGEKPRSAEAKEATPVVFSGLPTIEDINHVGAKIASALMIEKSKEFYSDLPIEIPQSKHKFTISTEQFQQFENEYTEDLKDFHLRVQRLKIRILGQYLSGYWNDGKDTPFDERNKTYSGKIISLLAAFKHRKEPLDADKRKGIIDAINKYLPEEHRLLVVDGISHFDTDQLYDLSFDLQFGKLPKGDKKDQLKTLLEEVKAIEGEISTIEIQEELFQKSDQGYLNEARLVRLWDQYRKLLKKIASYEELESWFSPTYETSGKGQRGEKQESSPFRTDYQRFQMPEMKSLEYKLGSSYFGEHEYGEYVEHTLFNGGLNAFEAVFKLIDEETERAKRRGENPHPPIVFKTKDIYFEVDAAINRYYRARGIDVQEFNPDDIKKLAEGIKKELPGAAFIAPLSNMFEMGITPIAELFEALSDPKWQELVRGKFYRNDFSSRHLYIVIDNSALGRLAKWRNIDFRKLPRFVRVLCVESLIKYGQDGQDLVQAGLVTSIGEYTASSLRDIRSRSGFAPTENTVRKLVATVPSDLTDKKMERHSRNSMVLAKKLEAAREVKNSFISRVVFPGLESHPQHDIANKEFVAGGGLVNIGLDFDFLPGYQESRVSKFRGSEYTNLDRAIDQYNFHKTAEEIATAFTRLVTVFAKEAGVEINGGTSYGFHTTRVAVYSRTRLPSDASGIPEYGTVPYIRVATGTENIKDMLLISEIIARVNEIFSRAISEKRIIALSQSILDRHEGKIAFVKSKK